MSRTANLMFTVLLGLIGLTLSAHVQPIQESELSSVPERLREFLLIRRLINNLKVVEAGHEIPAAVEDPSRIRLEHELQMLAKALEADMDFEDLHVSTRAVRSFCAGNGSRQCRLLSRLLRRRHRRQRRGLPLHRERNEPREVGGRVRPSRRPTPDARHPTTTTIAMPSLIDAMILYTVLCKISASLLILYYPVHYQKIKLQ
nr:uncharacterized protein LOC113820349 isoform X1 [Penaeus vannamei]